MSPNYPLSKSSRPPSLENLLYSEHLLTKNQIEFAKQFMKESDVNFGTAVMFLSLVSADVIGKVLSEQFSIPMVDSRNCPQVRRARKLIPQETALQLQVFPLNFVTESGHPVLMVGMTDPLDMAAINRLEAESRVKVQPVFIALSHLQQLFKDNFPSGLSLFPPEVTAFDKKVVKSRTHSLKSQSDKEQPRTAKLMGPLKALIYLLIKKGVFTEKEWQAAVNKYA